MSGEARPTDYFPIEGKMELELRAYWGSFFKRCMLVT